MSQKLRAESVIKSLAVLERRIGERFPNRGLLEACTEVRAVADKTEKRARSVGQPNVFRYIVGRGISLILVLGCAVLIGWPLSPWADVLPEQLRAEHSIYDVLEVLLSGLLVLVGALFWLREWGSRAKRRFVLRHLHELRSYAHVVDMHQLTKDPIAISPRATRTESSPERTMSPFELARYLNYCTELLSLLGKLAALYAEYTTDPDVTAAVNDVETLTAGIARKIWQKIMVLDNDIAMEAAGQR